jgi:uncharacterized OsmC-like protein
MKFSAQVENSKENHIVTLQVGENTQSITIPPKNTGYGSSVSGGELLFLALATCYCNDIYREAAKKNIKVKRVQVNVEGDFPAAGEPARDVVYNVKVAADAGEEEIRELMKFTDTLAEVQNTVRMATPVILSEIEVLNY